MATDATATSSRSASASARTARTASTADASASHTIAAIEPADCHAAPPKPLSAATAFAASTLPGRSELALLRAPRVHVRLVRRTRSWLPHLWLWEWAV